MPSKAAKPRYQRIYCGRYALLDARKAGMFTEVQSAVLAANTVRSWLDCYELYPADDVKDALKAAGIAWRDTKNEPKVKSLRRKRPA